MIQKSSSHCKKIKKENGLGQSLKDAKALLYLTYKAYSYWPGVFLESGLKLKDIELLDETSSYNEGELLEIAKDYIILGCVRGSLKIKTLQAPSKKAMNSADYIRGQRLQEKDLLI